MYFSFFHADDTLEAQANEKCYQSNQGSKLYVLILFQYIRIMNRCGNTGPKHTIGQGCNDTHKHIYLTYTKDTY